MSLKQGSKIEEGSKTKEGSKTEQDRGCSPTAIHASCASLDWHNLGPGVDGFSFQFVSLLAFVRARFRAWLGGISGSRKFAFRLGFVGGRDSAGKKARDKAKWWWWGIGSNTPYKDQETVGQKA
jgi:hypothetical protein